MKKILLAIAAIFIGAFGLLVSTPTFAAKINATNSKGETRQFEEGSCVETAILAEWDTDGDGKMDSACDGGNGDSVIGILEIVLNIMTVCIGIVGAIGITVVGIQYMTAADNEEQVRKSKRRMLEIVIGFAAYVLVYALLKWLLPSFK
ncbi:MAG: hypothetical protein Q4B29_00435 [Candidatus Saccharibacteria bacterium]|nr:hypothetical protein [Candidatus Saccharibacteria bacterium]